MMRTTLVAAVLAIGALLSLATHVGAQQSSPTIFWIDGTAIKSANLDGTGEQTLTTESSTPGGIAVYASQVYWTAGSSIKSMNWDGSGTETVLTDGSAALRGLAVDGAKVYWASSDSIKSANLDGTGEQTLATAAVATAVAVSSEKVYFSFRWNSSGFYRLSSMDKSGSNTSVIYSAPTASNSSRAIYGIAVNEPSGKVYAVQTTSSGYNSGGQFIWNTGSISLLSWDLDGSNYSSLKTLSGTRGSVLSNAGYVAYSQDPSRIVVAYAGSRVRSYDTSGGDEQTPSISVTALKGLAFQALDLPIVTVSTSESTAALEWNAIDGATDYQYRYKQKTELSWSTPATTGETTALVTGLIAGTDYDFQVRSRLNGIAEEWSGTAYARTSPRTLMITRWPARVGGVVIQDQGMGSAQMQWQHQVNALDYEIGLWDAGQLHDLAVQGASATVTIPDVWEQVNASLGVLSGDIYPEFDPANPYVGPYEDDPAKVILQRNRRYSGNILYYWHTGMGIWRVLRCESPTDGGCDYGSPSSAEVRTVVTVRSSIFNWFNLDAGPPEWGGVYTDEDEALEAASVAGVTVIFLDPLGYARYRRLNSTSPSATVTGLADGRQYLAVRGVTSDGRYGAWSYLGTMGTELAPAPSVPDSLGATTDLFYTDKLIVSQNYQYDEETLIIQWPSLLGARHYDIRLHGTNVQRIPAAGGAGQEIGLNLDGTSDTGVEYEIRGVIVAGTLSHDILDENGQIIYIVPPGRTAYSRWSASRVALLTEDGTVAPGSEALLMPLEPTEQSSGIIRELLRATQLDDDASDDEVGRWMLPIGVLGSVVISGVVAYGSGRGRFDKAAVIAGGMVFVLCMGVLSVRWLGLNAIEVGMIFISVLIIGILIAVYQYIK